MKKYIKIFTLTDIIIIIILCLLSLTPFLYISHIKYNKPTYLKVTIDDRIIRYNLDNKIINLDKYNKNMTIEVKNRKARIVKSDCPLKLCVKRGWIEHCRESAICLPNKVAIQIECKDSDIDAIIR
ncbi:MAG: NusG domain II-containing protein [Deferribacterota bacterium]|nr:NusG domain II-containing protein [Deferribacterota bacterium]